MDEAQKEKDELLESIRLQDAALSATVDNTITAVDSDSDAEEGLLDVSDADGRTHDLVVKGDRSARVNNEPSWAEALEANQEYDAVLAQVEEEIRQHIRKIENQVKDVRSKIDSVTNLGTGSLNCKSHWLYPFGMPYFKTGNFFPCPFNEDYQSKIRNNEICWSDLPDFHQWVTHDKKALNTAVRTLSLQKCEEQAHYQLAVMQKELVTAKTEGNEEKIATLEETIASFDVSDVARTMLQDVIENDEHDWMLISTSYLDGRQSPEMCRSFWHLYLHPKINKSPYSEEEEKKLAALAEKYGCQDWDKIAAELGTNRSGYQCFIVFQNKLNTSLKKNVWDPDEDLKLLKTVEKHRIGDYIPWGKVAYHMEGRTKTQVFNRWTYSVNPRIRKGRFTPDEDIMILVGVKMWGEDFQRISNFLKERTTCQIRDRYKHYLNRPGFGLPWTIEDDELLLKLVGRHGRDWSRIAEHFPSKDRTQVRHRFNTITRWREKCPDAPLSEAPSRTYQGQHHKEFQEQWNKARAILRCESVEEMVKAKNSIVLSIVKCKRKPFEPVKKRKQSVVETDLVNFFRCSYNIPGGHRKARLFSGDAQKYAGDLIMIYRMLKAVMNFPSTIMELHRDFSLPPLDKEILTALLKQLQAIKDFTVEFPPELDTSEEAANRRLRDNLEAANHRSRDNLEAANQVVTDDSSVHPRLFCDIRPSYEVPETTEDIDYTPVPDDGVASLYIDLPLMDLETNTVVADRNQNTSLPRFASVDGELNVCDGAHSVRPSTVKGVTEVLICPPNLTSLVGLRTFLLNRRNLVEWSNAEVEPTVTRPCAPSEKFLEARRKFDERVFSLFLWPALMSRYGPGQNEAFLNDSDKDAQCPQKESVFSSADEEAMNVTDSDQLGESTQTNLKTKRQNVDSGASTSTSKDPCASVPPKKRRRVKKEVAVAEDSDPDNPEAIV